MYFKHELIRRKPTLIIIFIEKPVTEFKVFVNMTTLEMVSILYLPKLRRLTNFKIDQQKNFIH